MISKGQLESKPGLVLLCPISRTKSLHLHLQRICSIAKSKSVVGVVIINKTPISNLSDSLVGEFEGKYIKEIYSSQKERIFVSQSQVSIDKEQWILQLHDDDDFHGYFNLEERDFSKLNHYFVPNLHLARRNSKVEELPRNSPNYGVFTAIPCVAWDTFRSVVRTSNPLLTDHLDYSLSRFIQSVYFSAPINTFSYYYNASNWSGRKATSHSRMLFKEILPDMNVKHKALVIYLDRFFATLAMFGYSRHFGSKKPLEVYYQEKASLIGSRNSLHRSNVFTFDSLSTRFLSIEARLNLKNILGVMDEIQTSTEFLNPDVLFKRIDSRQSSQLNWLLRLWANRLQLFVDSQ